MGDVQTITGPKRAEALARDLNSGHRTRPAVVVSTPGGAPTPWIDAERLVGELGELADVFVLATPESSWAFSSAMPSRTQVYGGAGRVYPANLDWVHEPTRSRLRFAYTPFEGEAATVQLIEDTLAAVLRAGTLTARPGSPATIEVTGVIKGCPTTSQALVALPGGYASIQIGMLLPGVPSDRVFAAGMQVRGALDERARRLDVRASLPDPGLRLQQIRDGDVLWARIESVGPTECEIAPYPGGVVRVPWHAVATSAEDDLRDLMSVGEIVAVHAARSSHDGLTLTVIGPDADTPCSALSIFPDGPPWLLPPLDPPPRPPATGRDQDEPAVPLHAAARISDISFEAPAPTSEPTANHPPPTEAVPTGDRPPAPATPRPTPLLIRPRHRIPPEPTAPTPPQTPPAPGSREALRGMGLQLDAARARILVLEAAVATAAPSLRSAQAELLLLERDLADQARTLAASEANLRRLRARIRKNVQEDRRIAGQREVPPGEDLFLDPAEQFRFEVTDRWARRILAAEKSEKPLRSYRFGPRFLGSLRETPGVDRSKVADVVVDVLTGLAEGSTGRDMHPLRSGNGGDDPVLRREGYTCWRVAVQRRAPQARRLHFWRSADDIELSRVVLHDDYLP